MLELTGFLGLTRISFFFAHTDPTLLLCGWEISQMLLCVGWLVRIPLCFWAHTDLTDPTVLLCGWEISQMLLCVGGSCGFHFAFGLTRISQIPQYCCVGGKSHRCFCGWLARADSTWFLGSHGSHRSHSIALWVGNLTDGSVGVGSWGLHGARSHGLIFWTLRTNQTYRTNRTDWTFLKIIRESGICVRPRWTPCGRVTKLQKIVLFGGRFERFEKKVWKKLLH